MQTTNQFVPDIQKETDFAVIKGEKFEVKRRCEKCSDPKIISEKSKRFDHFSDVWHYCRCEKEARLNAKIKHLKSLSLLGTRFENATFESSLTGANSSFDKALERCKEYCENYKSNLENGQGIYLFGDIGVGKTHISACIANYLISKCIPVLFTSLFEISKAIKSTFNRDSNQTEQELIEKFSNFKVLFFDDLGTEILSKNSEDTWLQSILFDIINRRYNEKKSTIFSNNHSINDLVNIRGLMDKTADRMAGMSKNATLKISGESMRGKLENKPLPF